MKATIRQNAWGNWYGYVNGKKAAFFNNTSTETQEQQAQRWLARTEEIYRRVAENMANLVNTPEHQSLNSRIFDSECIRCQQEGGHPGTEHVYHE